MQFRSRDEREDTQHVPGLARLAPESVEHLLKVGRLVHIPKGWTPIQDKVPADKAYLILEGTMEVVDGGEVIARVGVGAFVGEMGLVDHALRSARVTVTDPVLAIAWPKEDFQESREKLPDFDELVSATARERILENDQRPSAG
jgi:signal-transduction protein with cAMP-binding, CBS, and nucleotidyltransferase domain